MALYLVKSNDPGEITVLVRARNGDHARELAGYPDGWVARVTEDGDFGVVHPQMSGQAEPERKRRKPRQRFLGDPPEPDDPGEE